MGLPTNGGTTSITNAGANVSFNPGADFQDLQTGASRQTSFTYTVSDGNGGTDTATVTITVNGVSDAPVADDETFSGSDSSAIGNTTLIVERPDRRRPEHHHSRRRRSPATSSTATPTSMGPDRFRSPRARSRRLTAAA